jgi:Zn-dependent protease with chaperone function
MLLAIALMVGFYLLGTGIAVALIVGPIILMMVGIHFAAGIAVFGFLTGFSILWSLIPRPDRFTPSGILLSEEDQPHLWQDIRQIADATRQRMPIEIYLTLSADAAVTHRGGIMTIGGRRVMSLGLFLLPTLRVRELHAVIAHEFGHYESGDIALAAWIYKTRAALGRTLQRLSQGSSRLVRRPFLAYATTFLQLTGELSQRQEFAADALAARVVGARPLIGGLKTVQRVEAALSSYRARVEPVLGAGFLPPLAEGFSRYLGSTEGLSVGGGATDNPARGPDAAPYDTHPSVQERIAALGWPSSHDGPTDERLAMTLLAHPSTLERDLIAATMLPGRNLTAIGWEDVGIRVAVPAWDGVVQRHRALLVDLTLADIPESAHALLMSLANTHEAEWQTQGSSKLRVARAGWMLGAVVGSALARAGWAVETMPGEPVRLRGPSEVLTLFEWAESAASGQIDPAEWRQRCEQGGIAGLRLAV